MKTNRVETIGTSKPEIVLITGKDGWNGTYRVSRFPWIYAWSVDGVGRDLVIPEGYVTDLASVPRIAWLWIAPWELKQAALPHDLLYQYAGCPPAEYFLLDGEPSARRWKRREVDQLFARIMREDGVPKAKRRAAYLAVRMGGWKRWRRARRDQRL